MYIDDVCFINQISGFDREIAVLMLGIEGNFDFGAPKAWQGSWISIGRYVQNSGEWQDKQQVCDVNEKNKRRQRCSIMTVMVGDWGESLELDSKSGYGRFTANLTLSGFHSHGRVSDNIIWLRWRETIVANLYIRVLADPSLILTMGTRDNGPFDICISFSVIYHISSICPTLFNMGNNTNTNR